MLCSSAGARWQLETTARVEVSARVRMGARVGAIARGEEEGEEDEATATAVVTAMAMATVVVTLQRGGGRLQVLTIAAGGLACSSTGDRAVLAPASPPARPYPASTAPRQAQRPSCASHVLPSA